MKKTLDELVDLRSSAIIVIDMQNDFCDPSGAGARYGADVSTIQDMIPHMQRFFAGARSVGAQLIFVQCIHEPSTDSETWLFRHDGVPRPHCRKDTWGADFCGVAPQGTEPIVIKHRYSAFIGTRFESVLKTLGIRTLIMTGVGTNVCVESTARDGFMLDYNIVFLSDCTATASPSGAHEATLQNMRSFFGTVATSDEVLAVWRSKAAARAVA
jgi:ureidoacrylate peracid hydrolase